MFKKTLYVVVLLFFASFAYGQITIDFEANQTFDCESLAVSLTDMSSSSAGNIVSWEWEVAGVFSTLQNPSQIISEPGSYDVCLMVMDDAGNSESYCEENYLIVYALPQPDFSATPVAGCAPLEVAYTDLSTAGDAEIVSWLWGTNGEFDGGTNPVHSDVYPNEGVYNVTLTVIDENGCANTVVYYDFLTVNAIPEVSFNTDVNSACEPPLVVNFSNTSPANGILYHWDFGNGQVFDGFNPPQNQVVYNSPGVYTVQLIAEDLNAGCNDTLVLENYIQVGSVIDMVADQFSTCQGSAIAFQDLSTTVADSIHWNFGDGGTSTSATPSYVFDTPGCYTVSLTRFVNGCPSTKIFPGCFEVFELPEVSYSLDNQTGCLLDFDVNFTSNAPDAVSYEWDFESDGIIDDTSPNPFYTYTDFGEYTVSLTVYNANGCAATNTSAVVSIVELEATLEMGQAFGCAPLNVSLSESNNSVAPIVNWEWEIIGDNFSEFLTGPTPDVVLNDTGIFDVKLTITNLLGCEDVVTFEDIIGVGMLPDADFVADPVQTCVDNSVVFTNLSSPFVNEWFWDFGDNATSDLANPQHEYQDTGMFSVSLIVGHNGCFKSTVFTDYIDIIEPLARFDVVYDCGNPLQVSFEDNSIGAESFHWDFGVQGETADTSILPNPVFVYPDTGTYAVTLNVFNESTGCSHSFDDTLIITEPRASFSLSTNQGCVPLEIQLMEDSESAITYQWFSDIPDEDGAFSDANIADPLLTISTSGMYNGIGLIITDINDCTDTLFLDEPILVNEVTANFEVSPLNGCAPLEVVFNDLSTNLFAENNSWVWGFGDGNEIAGVQTTTHIYDTSGFYPITLKVGDTWGCQKSWTIDSLVDVTYPIAAFSTDSLSCTQTVVNFTNLSQGRELQYFWDFGDGTTSALEVPNHQYALEGTYTICLNVTDLYGCSDQTCLEDYLVVANPVAGFTVDNTYGDCPPLLVSFESTSVNGTIFEYDFGDGSGLSNQENPQNVYITPGTYDVTLVVSSTTACSDTLFMEDFITLEGPLGDFHFEIDSSCVPMSVTFFAESNDAYSYIWDYGDGTSLDTTLNVSADTITHFYNIGGTFIPKIIFIDETGCKRTVQSPDPIIAPALAPDFEVDGEAILCNIDSVRFVNTTISSHDLQYIEWQFESGDPAVSFDPEPFVNYAAPGNFDVLLIVDNGFCRDSILKENYIGVGPLPVVDFDLTESEGCSPLGVSSLNNSSVSMGAIASYEWNYENGNTASSINFYHDFETVGQNEIQLIVTTDVGCKDSLSRFVEIYPVPEISAGTAPEICIGEVVQLEAQILSDTAGVSFYWEAAPSLSCFNCLDPQASPVDTTTYIFVAVSPDNCLTKSEVTVNVRPYEIPDIVINPYPEVDICANDLVQLNAQGGDNIYAYQWDTNDPGLSCYENCFNPVAQPQDTTTYHLVVTSMHGCSNTDSVTVNVINMFQPIAGADRTICKDEDVQLNVETGSNPVWSPATGMSCVYCPSPVAAPDSTVTYVVSVTTDIGCEIFDSVKVEVLTEQDIDAGEDQVVCKEEETTLIGQAFGEISWSSSAQLSDSSSLTVNVRPLESGYHYLSATQDLCTLTDSVFIAVKTKTEVSGQDTTICIGDEVELVVEGAYDKSEWKPSGTLSDINVSNPIAFPEINTVYEFIAQLSTCEPDTAFVTVNVNPLPQIQVTPERNFIVGQTVQMEVGVTGSPNLEYQWTPSDGLDCANCPEPFVNIDQTATYELAVYDIDSGCWNYGSTKVNLLNECPEELVKLPNIFSPNEDGRNDEIGIEHSPAISAIKSLEIFDRWGALVFKTRNINDTWDGKFQNKLVADGVYVYLLQYVCPLTDELIIVQGDVTVLK